MFILKCGFSFITFFHLNLWYPLFKLILEKIHAPYNSSNISMNGYMYRYYIIYNISIDGVNWLWLLSIFASLWIWVVSSIGEVLLNFF